jgi:hypothetical protein
MLHFWSVVFNLCRRVLRAAIRQAGAGPTDLSGRRGRTPARAMRAAGVPVTAAPQPARAAAGVR